MTSNEKFIFLLLTVSMILIAIWGSDASKELRELRIRVSALETRLSLEKEDRLNQDIELVKETIALHDVMIKQGVLENDKVGIGAVER